MCPRSAYTRRRVEALREKFGIWDSLPPPGFSESGIHLASATGKPPWIHVQGFVKWAKKNLDSGIFFLRCADCPHRVEAPPDEFTDGVCITSLHVEYAERGNEYGILFRCSLFCENVLEYVRIHAIYRVNQAEYVIHILVVAP